LNSNFVSQKAGWRINEWGASVGLGRSSVYDLVGAGKIQAVKYGRAHIITTSPVEFLASLAGKDAG
jgi:hypothetical protein